MSREAPAIARFRQELGERLATFRKAADITQGALAKATSRDRTAISHLENGRMSADERFWGQADALCRVGGVLIAAFRRFEATKQAHEQQQRDAELAKYQVKANSYEPAWIPDSTPALAIPSDAAGETAALELLRRVTASDVGDGNVDTVGTHRGRPGRGLQPDATSGTHRAGAAAPRLRHAPHGRSEDLGRTPPPAGDWRLAVVAGGDRAH